MSSTDHTDGELARTPLHALHLELGAKMVPFAGYDMPVQYPAGIMAEHRHTRAAAGLFDVSHMGQASLVGPDHETTARAFEALAPVDAFTLAPGRQRYTFLTNDGGGILDDLMIARPGDPAEDGRLDLVVNAACKQADFAHIAANLPDGVRLETFPDRALLALQGPTAAAVLAVLCPAAADLAFMSGLDADLLGAPCHITRSGYTGEDGYEISCPGEDAERIARQLLTHGDVAPIGLGARDSLRLEAGLCLYGHDIDETTSPVEADLLFALPGRRREEGGYPGHERIARELAEGPARKRVGIRPDGRAPAREGTEILDTEDRPVGIVTSGGYGPTADAPVAMGYVPPALAEPGTTLNLIVRGRAHPAKVAALPFVPQRYYRKPKA